MRKTLRKFLSVTLIVGTLTFAPEICGVENFPVVHAEMKMYTAMGADYGNEFESQDVVKLRARDKAIKNAVKQAGVYLKTYSRSVNSELTDDEVLTITSNSYELVGEVQYNRVTKQVTDQIILIVWEATVNVNVDDGEISKWFKRDDRDRSTLISQTRESQVAADENDRKVEDLRKRAANVSDDAGRAQLKTQFEQADNEFLSNQKVEEGNRAAYKGKFDVAEKFYSEAIELNPNNPKVYVSRGCLYSANIITFKYNLKDIKLRTHGNDAKTYYNLALKDFDAAIGLSPNDAVIYAHRGYAHHNFEKYQQALADYNKGLQIDPSCLQIYLYRSMYWRFVAKDNKSALADLNKAVELNPDAASGYSMRGLLYEDEQRYDLALDDLSKAIELEPNGAHNYYSRGDLYKELKMFNKAIDDYTKYISLTERENPESVLLKWVYKHRAECYKAIGDNAKAQADMNKYEELK